MNNRLQRAITIIVAMFDICVGAAGAQDVEKTPRPACELPVSTTGNAAAVHDGRTVVLADGREVRLAGIEVPLIQNNGGRNAKTTLETLVIGQTITLRSGDSAGDRYGRWVGYIFTGGENSVQNEMVAQGYARVSTQAEPCRRELLTTEKQARDQGRGLWMNADYRRVPADQAAMIAAQKSRFALVEGKVLSVRDSGATIYMNFGRRFTQGFAVTILKRNLRMFSAAEIVSKQLEGKPIRVRGVIEQRTGPIVEASRPEQIELVN